jgi:flagellar protein FliS
MQGHGPGIAASAARDRYKQEAVTTMSPGRMVIALYDRLILDLDRAVAGIEADDLAAAHTALVHAQDILTELHDSLALDAWPAAAQLADLYRYLLGELVAANVSKDAVKIASCRTVVVPLRDAWAEAAAVVPTGSSGRT